MKTCLYGTNLYYVNAELQYIDNNVAENTYIFSLFHHNSFHPFEKDMITKEDKTFANRKFNVTLI